MAEKIRVVATFAVQPDKIDAFLEAAQRALVEPTQGEPGCIEYAIWQDSADSTRFAMLEEWESEEHLAAHLAQPGLQEAVGKLAPLVAEAPTVRRLRRPRPTA